MRLQRVVPSVTAVSTVLLGACTLFTDFGGYADPASPTAEPSVDGAVVDAGSKSDGSSTALASDSAPPAIVDTGVPDNIVPSKDGSGGAPCNDPGVLVGRSDVQGLVTDSIPSGSIDTYPFVAANSGIARCVWVWVGSSSASKSVRVGIYAHDNAADHPAARLGFAVLPNVTEHAWNKVALTDPITITQGAKIWLGMSPVGLGGSDPNTNNVMEILMKDGNCPPPYMHAGAISDTNGSPPDPFIVSDTYVGSCDAAVYLGL